VLIVFFSGYTEEQLRATGDEDVLPDVNVGIFYCLAGDEVEYSGSYCLCDCVGGQDPNKVCSRKTNTVRTVFSTQTDVFCHSVPTR
jgi:hypothetical protein